MHGNPTWSFLWRSLLQHVEANDLPWRVVAVDQLDMGFSARTGVFRRLADRVNDLGDLTKALALRRPRHHRGPRLGRHHLAGLGAGTPRPARSVVLTNTAVHPAGHDLPAALRLATHPAVHGWGTTTSSAFLRTTLALAQPALSPEVHDAFMAPYRGPRRRAGVGNFVADIPFGPTHPSRPALDSISEGIRSLDVPALLLWGPKDPVFSDRYLRDLMDRLPQAAVHRFEGASHLLPEDRDVAAPVFDWLDDAPRPGAGNGRID